MNLEKDLYYLSTWGQREQAVNTTVTYDLINLKWQIWSKQLAISTSCSYGATLATIYQV